VATSQDKKGKVSPEIGNLGVSVDFQSIYSDSLKELQFPYSLKTFDQMAKSSVVASVLSAVNTIAGQADFYLDAYDQSDTHLSRKKFVEQCLFYDMKTSFNQVVKDFLTATQYGFSILEKVFRERRYSEGSLYDDGKIGIKYLPLRSQKSIEDFKYDDMNRELIYVLQSVSNINLLKSEEAFKKLPADRIMLFKVNSSSNYPYGRSPLADAYMSWRVLEELRGIETVSANRNLNGIPHLSCPSEIMDESSDDPEDRLRVTKLKQQMSRISTGEQAYIITPSDRYDQTEGASAQYDFKVVTGSSSHLTALGSIISRYKNEVFQAMCADILTIDDGQSASSSLTTNKQTMFNMFVEARLREFIEVINSDLIPDLFARNGWDITKTPKLKYDRVEKLTVAEMAKAIQQLSATQTIPITVENTNYIAEIFGFPYRVPEYTTFDELLKLRGYGLDIQSRSGDGLAVGTVGEGTAKSVSGSDKNADNLNKN
jgi:hypothetical protein